MAELNTPSHSILQCRGFAAYNVEWNLRYSCDTRRSFSSISLTTETQYSMPWERLANTFRRIFSSSHSSSSGDRVMVICARFLMNCISRRYILIKRTALPYIVRSTRIEDSTNMRDFPIITERALAPASSYFVCGEKPHFFTVTEPDGSMITGTSPSGATLQGWDARSMNVCGGNSPPPARLIEGATSNGAPGASPITADDVSYPASVLRVSARGHPWS